jgi:hypothetical protein
MLGKLSIPEQLTTRLAEQGFALLHVTRSMPREFGTTPNCAAMIRSIACWSLKPLSRDCDFSPPIGYCLASDVGSSWTRPPRLG